MGAAVTTAHGVAVPEDEVQNVAQSWLTADGDIQVERQLRGTKSPPAP